MPIVVGDVICYSVTGWMVRLVKPVTIWSTTCLMIFASPNFTLKIHHAFRDVHRGIKKGNIRWIQISPSRMIQYSLKVSVVSTHQRIFTCSFFFWKQSNLRITFTEASNVTQRLRILRKDTARSPAGCCASGATGVLQKNVGFLLKFVGQGFFRVNTEGAIEDAN